MRRLIRCPSWPVVCVHGYTWSLQAFNALARHLPDRFRLIVPDVRGHRESAWSPTGAYLLTTERIRPELAAMVGDRAVDIHAARTNGIRSVRVLWGYGSRGELVDADVDELCATPIDLGRCLSNLAVLQGEPPLRG
ncbi:MAG: hypothetical protein DMD76_29985 [Candidatus Rokuibacteriota bacterium]|nr:MAG: hypothetical protein DMD76_29985 [Candidatus Rokubacteria bacterium]